jgi:hypothetical protein
MSDPATGEAHAGGGAHAVEGLVDAAAAPPPAADGASAAVAASASPAKASARGGESARSAGHSARGAAGQSPARNSAAAAAAAAAAAVILSPRTAAALQKIIVPLDADAGAHLPFLKRACASIAAFTVAPVAAPAPAPDAAAVAPAEAAVAADGAAANEGAVASAASAALQAKSPRPPAHAPPTPSELFHAFASEHTAKPLDEWIAVCERALDVNADARCALAVLHALAIAAPAKAATYTELEWDEGVCVFD